MFERERGAGHQPRPLANGSAAVAWQWRADARTFCLAPAPGLAPAQLPRARTGAQRAPEHSSSLLPAATVLPLNWTSRG